MSIGTVWTIRILSPSIRTAIMETLIQLLNHIAPLSDELRQCLIDRHQLVCVKKGEFLQYPAEQSARMNFIQSGLVKGYYLKDGKEMCTWFHNEGTVVVSISSWYRRQPTDEFIKALEDTEVISYHHDDIDFIYENFVEFNRHGRMLTEQYHLLIWEWLKLMRGTKARERYAFFLKHFGDWVKRVPAKDIADFLGISQWHLSYSKRQI